MADQHDIDDDLEPASRHPLEEEEDETESAPRNRLPRFGPFLTIAVAILMLFGVASRFGKTESGGWLNLDFLASKSLDKERHRLQEQRNTTLVTLGAIPASAPIAPPPTHSAGIRLDSRAVLPPSRGEFDLDEYQAQQQQLQRQQLSMPVQTGDGFYYINNENDQTAAFDPVPEAKPASQPVGGVYTVKQGDNWVKVGKATGKRWQDIQAANPSSKDGLRVGMKLVVP